MKEIRTEAIIKTALSYTKSIFNKNGIALLEEARRNFLKLRNKNLGDVLCFITENCMDFCTNQKSATCINNIKNLLVRFYETSDSNDYLKSCKEDFDLLQNNDYVLPILLLLDYYMDNSPIEISFKGALISWPDYLLLNYYYDNISASYCKGSDSVIDYIIDNVLCSSLTTISADERIIISVTAQLIYQNCLYNKIENISIQSRRKEFENMSNIISQNYDVNETVTLPLASYIREVFPLVNHSPLTESSEIEKVWFRLGNVNISDIHCSIKNDTISFTYSLNQIKRTFSMVPGNTDSVEKYLFYPDMLVYILAVKAAVGLYSGQIASITRRYSLMMFRAVLLDGDIYSEFLSLVE